MIYINLNHLKSLCVLSFSIEWTFIQPLNIAFQGIELLKLPKKLHRCGKFWIKAKNKNMKEKLRNKKKGCIDKDSNTKLCMASLKLKESEREN